MMILSYLLGRKYYPVPYDLKKIFFYFTVALVLFALSSYFKPEILSIRFILNSILFLLFVAVIGINEKLLFRNLKV